MLKEIRESEESWYPVNSSNPPKGSGNGHGKGSGYYDKKNYDKHGHGSYPAWAVNVQTDPDEYISDSLSDIESDFDINKARQDRSYHVGITEMADEVEGFFGRCYNCRKEGHPWCDLEAFPQGGSEI